MQPLTYHAKTLPGKDTNLIQTKGGKKSQFIITHI